MTDFDVIVVGSGISGGWAAKELTEKGLKVLVLERGRHITHGDDYVGEHKAPWEFPFRGAGDRKRYEKDYPVQMQCYAFDEGSEHFFVNDRDHPYQSTGQGFSWIRGYHLGGRSLTWGRVSLRLGDINFSESQKDKHGISWPIGYDDLKSWYSYVEKFVGISGQKENFATLPDGEFLPPLGLNCIEQHLRSTLQQKYKNRTLTPDRAAVLSQDHNGRAACHYCGPCYRGCSTGSYFSSLSATLPAAQATGRLTILTDSIVAGIDYDPKTHRASGVRVINSNTNGRSTYTARAIFLNASTLGTTHILLNSKSEHFPNGLANSSGVLGHYLMDHVMGSMMTGVFEGFDDLEAIGNRPNGFVVPRFNNVDNSEANFLRGYGFQGWGARAQWSRGNDLPEIGLALKNKLRKSGPWYITMAGMGECLPYWDNRVSLNETKRDKWGLPQLDIHFEWRDNERKMFDAMNDEAGAILHAAGAVNVTPPSPHMHKPGLTIHEMGTARMGHDPKTSILNKHNQCHDVANVFVTDGACMTTSAYQNPSLTYMALTARAAHTAVEQMKAGIL